MVGIRKRLAVLAVLIASLTTLPIWSRTIIIVPPEEADSGAAAAEESDREVRVVSFQIDGPANSLLMQASAFAGENKPELVFSLLEQALAEASGELATADGEQFLPVRQMAMRIIRQMPPEALTSYRVVADASVSSRLAEYDRTLQLEPLEDCYRRYFLSSQGDQAAFIWACHLLDAGDFRRARAVLAAVHQEHPDPDVPAVQLLPRLALAHLRCQDLAGAKSAWQAYERAVGQVPVAWQPLSLELAGALAQEQALPDVRMALGAPTRDGWRQEAALPMVADSLWTESWHYDLPYAGPPVQLNPQVIQAPSVMTPATMTKLARQNAWQPTTQVVFAGGRVWVAGGEGLVGLNPSTGRADRVISDVGADGSVDPNMARLVQMLAFRGNATSLPEQWFFHSRAARAMSVAGSSVLRLESHLESGMSAQVMMQLNARRQSQSTPLGNRLAAVDAITGKVLWRVGRDTTVQDMVVVDESAIHDIPYLPGITIDGKGADWRGRGLRVRMPGKGDPQDLSATLWLGWNEEGLLARTEVTDNAITEAENTSQMFSGDSVEYFVAPRRGSRNMYQMIASTGSDPTYPDGRTFFYDHRQGNRGKSSQNLSAHVAQGKTDAGAYVVEALLLWSNVGVEPKIGVEAAFQHYVNDEDPGAKHWVGSWYPRTGTHANPSFMHRIRLVGETGEKVAETPANQEPPPEQWHVNGVRFLATPVPCAGVLVLPGEDEGGISIYGLNPLTGVPVWQTRLGASLPTSEAPASEMHLTVAGTSLYFCTGQGMVVAMDGTDGRILWGRLYAGDIDDPLPELDELAEQQEQEQDQAQEHAQEQQKLARALVQPAPEPTVEPSSWRENLVLVQDDVLLVFAMDTDRVQAYDRYDGAILWNAPRPTGVSYVVGRAGPLLILAGGRAVAAIKPFDGSVVWQREWPFVSGMPALSGDHLLVPADQLIEQLDLQTGQTMGKISLQNPDKLPIGNLYPCDDGVLVATATRLARIDRADDRLAELNARIAAAPVAADLAARGRINRGFGRIPAAAKDLQQALEATGAAAIREQLVAELLDLYLDSARRRPKTADVQYRAALALPLDPAMRARVQFQHGQYLLAAKQYDEAAAVLLAVLESPHRGPLPIDEEGDVLPAIWLAQHLASAAGQAWQPELRARLSSAVASWADAEPETRLYRHLLPSPTDDDAAYLAIQAEVTRLFAAQQDGLAVSLIDRHLPTVSPRSRQLLAASLVDYMIAARYPGGLEEITERMQLLDPDWQPTTRAGEAVDVGALKGAWLTRPVGLGWKAPTGMMNVMPANLPHAILVIDYQTREFKGLDWRDGSTRWSIQQSNNVNQNSFLNTRLFTYDATPGHTTTVDMWSGTSRTLTPRDAQWSSQKTDQTGLLVYYSAAANGTLEVVDLLNERVIWSRRDVFTQIPGIINAQLFWTNENLILLGWGNNVRSVLAFDKWTGTTAAGPKDAAQVNQSALVMGGNTLRLQVTPDALTGVDDFSKRTVWTTPAKLAVERTAPVPNGDVVIITKDKRTLYLNMASGRIIMASEPDAFKWNNVMSDTNLRSVIFMQHGNQPAVTAMDNASGRILFQGKLKQNQQPVSCLADGTLIAYGMLQITEGKRTQNYRQLIAVDPKTETVVAAYPSEEEVKAVDANKRNYMPFLTSYGILMVNRQTNESKFYPWGGLATAKETP